MNKLKSIVVLLLPLATGGLSAWLSGDKSMTYYHMPPLSPPEWLFPIVWTILYAVIGVASYLYMKDTDFKLGDTARFFYYGLLLNFVWPIVFFRFKMFTAAVIILILMIILSVAAAKGFFDKNKTAGWMMVPYIAWLLFALYLNIGVAVLN